MDVYEVTSEACGVLVNQVKVIRRLGDGVIASLMCYALELRTLLLVARDIVSLKSSKKGLTVSIEYYCKKASVGIRSRARNLGCLLVLSRYSSSRRA